MKDIIKINEPEYIIVRRKGDEKEYFNGANIYGRDNDNVLRVSRTKWSKGFYSMYTTHDLDGTKDILNGMRKYGEMEEGYNYAIAKIQVTTAIISYIEQ